MKITLDRLNEEYHFEAKGPSGFPVQIDSPNEAAKGASPTELFLMSIAGCNAIDVIMILNKQRQTINSYHIEIEGFRTEVEKAKPFDGAHVTIYLEGDIQPEKAKRAAALSFEKYCSVSITVRDVVEVTYDVIVNGEKVS